MKVYEWTLKGAVAVFTMSAKHKEKMESEVSGLEQQKDKLFYVPLHTLPLPVDSVGQDQFVFSRALRDHNGTGMSP
jgi:hypothetical protein